MATKKKTEKNVVVDRKFLLRLADNIYNPKNKTFLKLCTGELEGGLNSQGVPMHCGLGELYFQLTGKHPDEVGVTEDDVIALALEKSTIVNDIIVGIKGLKASPGLKADLIQEVVERAAEEPAGTKFKRLLNKIPGVNDDSKGSECSLAAFGARSRRVASVIRKAANVLPK